MKNKKLEYYHTKREDLIKVIPDGISRILDIGCGTGLTGRAIKDLHKNSIEVTGIEIEPDIAEKAKTNLDKVLVGNVESVTIPFPQGYFDCMIYGDVLEHLIDPWGLLARLNPFLKHNGYVIASIPNVAHYRILKMLGRKEWTYQDRGIMDKTHLRFFTIKSIEDMFGKASLNIVRIEHKISASRVKKIMNKILCGAILDFITEQYVIVARKS